jgi:transposase-like protein
MQSKNKSQRRRNESFWREAIRCWKESGKSQAAFCRERAIALSTFSCWRKRLKHNSGGAVFYPLVVSVKENVVSNEQPAPLRLLFAGKPLSIEIPGDFSEPVLRKLISTVEALP